MRWLGQRRWWTVPCFTYSKQDRKTEGWLDPSRVQCGAEDTGAKRGSRCKGDRTSCVLTGGQETRVREVQDAGATDPCSIYQWSLSNVLPFYMQHFYSGSLSPLLCILMSIYVGNGHCRRHFKDRDCVWFGGCKRQFIPVVVTVFVVNTVKYPYGPAASWNITPFIISLDHSYLLLKMSYILNLGQVLYIYNYT